MNISMAIVGTEPLSIGSYIALGLASLITLQAIVSIMYPFTIMFYNIAWRGDKPVMGYQEVKYGSCGEDVDSYLFDIVLGSIVAILLLALHWTGTANIWFTSIFTLGFLCASPYILRYFVDMYKALKMNNKTGDSDRLREIEKEMEDIKKRLN